MIHSLLVAAFSLLLITSSAASDDENSFELHSSATNETISFEIPLNMRFASSKFLKSGTFISLMLEYPSLNPIDKDAPEDFTANCKASCRKVVAITLEMKGTSAHETGLSVFSEVYNTQLEFASKFSNTKTSEPVYSANMKEVVQVITDRSSGAPVIANKYIFATAKGNDPPYVGKCSLATQAKHCEISFSPSCNSHLLIGVQQLEQTGTSNFGSVAQRVLTLISSLMKSSICTDS